MRHPAAFGWRLHFSVLRRRCGTFMTDQVFASYLRGCLWLALWHWAVLSLANTVVLGDWIIFVLGLGRPGSDIWPIFRVGPWVIRAMMFKSPMSILMEYSMKPALPKSFFRCSNSSGWDWSGLNARCRNSLYNQTSEIFSKGSECQCPI